METLTNDLKNELFEALSDLEISYTDFEHQLEDCATTYAKVVKQIETINLNIGITFEEQAIWSASDDYETNEFSIVKLEVIGENGEIYINQLTENELMKHINYQYGKKME